jgi:hypothetical protein
MECPMLRLFIFWLGVIFFRLLAFYFGFIWRMVSTFMEEDTKKKIFVLGPNYLEKMSKYIHFQSIPLELGGSGETLGQSPEELSFLDYVKSCNGNDESVAEKIIRKFT